MKKKRKISFRINPIYPYSTVLIFALIGLVYGMFLFFGGFHNIDLAQNIRYINAEFNLTIGDKASDYNVYTWENLFIMGANMLYKGFFLSLFCAFYIGIIVSELLGAMATLHKIRQRRRKHGTRS